MWINLNADAITLLKTLANIVNDVKAGKPTEPPTGWSQEKALEVFAQLLQDLEGAEADAKDPVNQDYVEAAKQAVVHEEGHMEVDDSAVVSRGDDPGAYVMAWIWVEDRDAKFESWWHEHEDDEELKEDYKCSGQELPFREWAKQVFDDGDEE